MAQQNPEECPDERRGNLFQFPAVAHRGSHLDYQTQYRRQDAQAGKGIRYRRKRPNAASW